MRETIIHALLTLLLKYLAGPARDDIVSLVEKFASAAMMTGDEKKQGVLHNLRDLSGPAGEFLQSMATWAVNLAIEAAVARLKLQAK
jgi:hypothetical protein